MKNRVGEKAITYQGFEIEIVRYGNAHDIDVMFNDEYRAIVRNRQYSHFKKGNIKNPYFPSVLNVGFIGHGRYAPRLNGKKTPQYIAWFAMMNRCYNSKYHSNHTYEHVSVCKEWHNFQNFAEWYDNNNYEINDEQMALDKDIVSKNSKVYSPETCVFVPKLINSLFTKNDSNRGAYPIGVSWHVRDEKYSSTCNNPITGKQEFLGYYENELDAFEAYRERKEFLIKEVAKIYSDKIPEKLYSALNNYIVELGD